MKSNLINKLALGLFIGIILSVGAASTANAQGRIIIRPRPVGFYRPYRPYWGYWGTTYRVVDPIASLREEGYSDGRSLGKDDAKDGRERNPEYHKQFNKSKSLAYREAFLQGYADGYRKQIKKED